MRLALLDGFELKRHGIVVLLPMSAQRLAAFLGLHERPLHRIYIAGTLWTDSPEKRSLANLRSALWRLQRVSQQLVTVSNTHLCLANDVVVDVRQVIRQAHRVLDGATADSGDDLSVASDLLPDWYDAWVVLERHRVQQLRLHALERICEQLIAEGQFGRAVEVALGLVASDPFRESARRALMQAYLAEGNQAEALHQYLQFRGLLKEDLGLEPSQQMEDLHGSLRPGPPAAVAPARQA